MQTTIVHTKNEIGEKKSKKKFEFVFDFLKKFTNINSTSNLTISHSDHSPCSGILILSNIIGVISVSFITLLIVILKSTILVVIMVILVVILMVRFSYLHAFGSVPSMRYSNPRASHPHSPASTAHGPRSLPECGVCIRVQSRPGEST